MPEHAKCIDLFLGGTKEPVVGFSDLNYPSLLRLSGTLDR